jgi:DNA-binding PadR family transcriptional regulator
VNSLLAVPVLSALAQQPMYPYQVATMLKDRGKDQAIKINWGSLYTVVQNLEKSGFIEAVETIREGKQPERTVYRITDAGRAELLDWLRELVGEPEREYTRLEAGLGDAGALHPDELISLLRQRLATKEAGIFHEARIIEAAEQFMPRLFVIEAEYHLALEKAEVEWIRGLLEEMETGTLAPEIEAWRRFHDTGEMPPEYKELFEQEARKYE